MGPDYMEGLISKMRAIHNPVTSFKRGKAQRPSSRQPSPGAPTGGPDRKLPGLHLFSGGAASLSINRRPSFLILALLAALAVGLLLFLPGGLLQAQQTADTYYHDENDPESVVTLTAVDPEGVTPIYWSFFAEDTDTNQDLPGGNVGPEADDIEEADFADNGLFDVEDGVLSFMAEPDYETALDAGENNEYKVVVQASDGGVTTWVQYFKVTVNVLDVEEDGEVTWTVDPDGTANTDEDAGQTLLEFQAGAVLTATVTDLDGPATIVADTTAWRWHRSPSNTGPWTMISDENDVPEMSATYTASDTADNNDVGMYLRATANYTDRRGSDKTADFVSLHTVKATKVENNSLPEFAPTAVERNVQEELAGANVGPPVTARDADDHVLNYDLLVGTAPVTPENFADYFAVNQATGQITTAAALNYETPGEGWQTVTDPVTEIVTKTFLVTVRATDSAGGETGGTGADDPDHATVTITLLNVTRRQISLH